MLRAKLPAAGEDAGPGRNAAAAEPAGPRPGDTAATLQGLLAQSDRLRQGLADKHAEIRRLRQAYRNGVDELEGELLHTIRGAGGDALAAARRQPRVEFLLLGMQRRQAYAERLERPLSRLREAGEELLYLERRAMVDLQVVAVARGVDLPEHERGIAAAVERFQPMVERLAPDAEDVYPPQPLETIWKRIIEKSKSAAGVHEGRNRTITEEVCGGNLQQLAELTHLSPRGAECLAGSRSAELFLTRLNEIPPAAAQKLSEWPGRWLCLPGLRSLSPEVAQHLFRWPGGWISLNGLNEISAETAAQIPSWQGRQLELMGLKRAAGIEHLAAWEGAGGKLFVPEGVRQQIERWRRSQRPPAGPEPKAR